MALRFIWTGGNNEDFRRFYDITEQYYNRIAGGAGNRLPFVPFNLSSSVSDVLLVFLEDCASACAGLKTYSEQDAEVKRVWVEPAYRGRHIATMMMYRIEERAQMRGYGRVILQTREIMADATGLYTKLGYHRIDNYPPYDRLEDAICYAKEL